MKPSLERDNAPYSDLPSLEDPTLIPNDTLTSHPDDQDEYYGDRHSAPGGIAYPHFDDVPYYYKRRPQRDSSIPMEEFIEGEGRWLTPEEIVEIEGKKSARKPRAKSSAEAPSGKVVVVDDGGIGLTPMKGIPEAVLGTTPDRASVDVMLLDSNEAEINQEDDNEGDSQEDQDDDIIDGIEALGLDDDDDDDDDDDGDDLQDDDFDNFDGEDLRF